MRLNKLVSSNAVTRGLLSLALAAGLASGFANVARADSPGTPIPSKAEALSSTSIRVYYTNTADECNGGDPDAETCVYFMMRYRLQSSVPDVKSSYTYLGGGGPSDDNVYYNSPLPSFLPLGFELGYAVSGLSPSTSYCFSLRSWVPEGGYSPWSGDVCGTTKAASASAPATPSAPQQLTPSVQAVGGVPNTVTIGNLQTPLASILASAGSTPIHPDLDAVQIAGPTTISNGDNDVYTATIRNDGAATSGDAEVEISYTGVLHASGTVQQFIGLTCTQDSGYTPNGFTCEGGTLAAGQQATLQFHASGASVGQGTITVALNPRRTIDESDLSNNNISYTVTVTK